MVCALLILFLEIEMISFEALRLAAIVVAHDCPRCNVLSLTNGGNALVAYCWATRAGKWQLQADWIHPTVPSVRAWLGY